MSDIPTVVLNKRNELERLSPFDAPAFTIDAPSDQISIVQFWRVLQKRRWLVLGSLAAVVVVVTAISLILPKRYDASARLLLDLDGNNGLGLEQAVVSIGSDLNTKLETQIRIVQSDAIATGVIEQLNLHQSRDFAGSLAAPPSQSFDSLPLRTRATLTQAFHKSLNVQLIPKTQIVEVHFRNRDARLAAQIANAVAASY
ncbi:MAG: Wzz/FepE/Etk N-terminal domain-containing protein, partial [Terriglobales bacterium]